RRDGLLGLVGHEVMQAVAHDRATHGEAVLLLARARLGARGVLRRGRLAPVVGGPVPEEVAGEVVGARARHGRDAGAAELVVLGLVVGRDHLVFGDAQLRKRIAAAGVLSGDAALEYVVLLADAVDEHVDAAGQLGSAAQRGR